MKIATAGDNIFRSISTKSTLKADITTETARAIVRAEAEHRVAKSARLRAARLKVESLLPFLETGSLKRTAKETTQKAGGSGEKMPSPILHR